VINDSRNKKQRTQGESDRSNQLLAGKAVLLIGNDTAVLQSLVAQLARKGADIALLCWHLPLEITHQLQESVQAFGRRLLLIERAENQRFSFEQLIHKVVLSWGHFDIFIDVSAKQESTRQVNEEEKVPNTSWLPPQWRLTQTVLREMAHA